MTPTATLIPVEEYLSTSYRPDREYLDGLILERNVGERDHSKLQYRLAQYMGSRERLWGLSGFTEQRIQVTPHRFRVPDLCFVRAENDDEQILTRPPVLCIEILSKDDRMSEMSERVDDYLRFGVPCVWIIDPRRRTASIYTLDGSHPVQDGVLRVPNTPIEVPLAEILQ